MRWVLVLVLVAPLCACIRHPTDGRELVATCAMGDVYLKGGRLYRERYPRHLEPIAQGVPIENVCAPI